MGRISVDKEWSEESSAVGGELSNGKLAGVDDLLSNEVLSFSDGLLIVEGLSVMGMLSIAEDLSGLVKDVLSIAEGWPLKETSFSDD
jgi:hypothetical protein